MRRGAPPLLHQLQAWFSQGEEYRGFVALTREYLPDCEAEILAADGVSAQVAAFARHFEARYFPLPTAFHDAWVEEYEQLTYQIPIFAMGISWDDFHSLEDWRPAYQLLFALTTDPYEEGEGGPRVSLPESCAGFVPRELLERVGGGHSPEELHACLDGTQFDGAALAADWLHHQTDTVFMDWVEEDAYAIQEDWDPETVRIATEQWARVREIQDHIDFVVDWLEVDLEARFQELLELIEKKGKEVKRGGKPSST
jgi:hypothetical protein